MEETQVLAGLIYGLLLLLLPIIILSVIGHWRLFVKAGFRGWESIIPFLNTFRLAHIAFGNNYQSNLLASFSIILSTSGFFINMGDNGMNSIQSLILLMTVVLNVLIYLGIFASFSHKNTVQIFTRTLLVYLIGGIPMFFITRKRDFEYWGPVSINSLVSGNFNNQKEDIE